MTYAIYHKTNQEYFVGFDINGDPSWGSSSAAVTWPSRLHAETQALLLAQDDEEIQREAVFIGSRSLPFPTGKAGKTPKPSDDTTQ